MERKIMAKLEQWKQQSDKRQPLVLKGVRQCGKTHILKAFGKQSFPNMAYVNLEKNQRVAGLFNADIEPRKLIRNLEVVLGARIIPGDTLLILDEIQSCERALTALKYFAEEAPEYAVVAAGSLLGVAVSRKHYSYPVGKVITLPMQPMDFEEFLWARGQQLLASRIRESYQSMQPLEEPLHQQAIDLYHEYLIVGGMPASVKAFCETDSFLAANEEQQEILTGYDSDMGKYHETVSESVKVRACFNSIPTQLAKENHKFQYKVVQRGGSATIFGASLEWLAQAGLTLPCHRVNNPENPLSVYADVAAFKLYMADTGLLTLKSDMAAV